MFLQQFEDTMGVAWARAWGESKRGFEVLARVEMCFEGMGGVEKGV